MTTPERKKPSPARRGSLKPRPAALDWEPIEQAAEGWGGLRITEDDLARVADFLATPRAPRLHRELVEFQETLRRGIKTLEWGDFDPATLIGLLLIAEHVREARDHGFPPGTAEQPVERWIVLLYRLLLAAEDAKLPVLSLAQRAMTADMTRDSAGRELLRRITERLGFNAAVVPLLDTLGRQDLAAVALARVRRAVAGKQKGLTEWQRRVGREEAREEIDAAAMLEIARRLGPGPDLARAVSAVMAALPAGPRASRWDYLARDTATRLHRADRRRQHRAPGTPGLDGIPEPVAREPSPAQITALRDFFRRRPRLLAALEAEMSAPDRETAARRLGVSTAAGKIKKLKFGSAVDGDG